MFKQCRPQRGLKRRDGMVAARPVDRTHPAARSLGQCLLRRAQAQAPVHGGQPVAVRGLYGNARRCAGLRSTDGGAQSVNVVLLNK